jgi:hypothetical protein
MGAALDSESPFPTMLTARAASNVMDLRTRLNKRQGSITRIKWYVDCVESQRLRPKPRTQTSSGQMFGHCFNSASFCFRSGSLPTCLTRNNKLGRVQSWVQPKDTRTVANTTPSVLFASPRSMGVDGRRSRNHSGCKVLHPTRSRPHQ